LPEGRLTATANIRIVLVGFMGAGKTTVGRLLGAMLQSRFLDLDDEIVQRDGRTIPEIFGHAGEAAFRQLEREALRDLLARAAPVVLAIGGGAFLQPENAVLLRQQGYASVFLDAPVEELHRRCAPHAASRPLFRDENQFRQLYECRRSAYMTADVRVDTAGKTPAQVAAEVASTLGVSV